MRKLLSVFTMALFFGSFLNAEYKKVESPFLGSTKDFKKVDGKKDLFVFRSGNKKAVDYKKFIFDSALIYQSPSSLHRQLTDDEILSLGSHFASMVKAKFGDVVQIVDAPGTGVLRVRFAIRGLKQGNYRMDASGAHKIVPDTRLAAGTIEMEAIDSLTGERVVALLQNVGSDKMEKSEKEETLQTVQAIFSDWVEMLRGVFLENQALSTIPK